ncbi:MAG: FAD/NAD(P)-binding oxidoreductase, partial [Bacteroidota bacterium]
MVHHQVVVVGGGSAGLSVASSLKEKHPAIDIAIVDPAEKHYYQPLWTLIGAGVFPKEESERSQADYIPSGATWIKEYVDTFDPDNNAIHTTAGTKITYDVLVVAAGIQINWDQIPGLKESVGKPGTGVCSNYSYDTVDSTWKNIQALKAGDTAIFTHPNTPIKCGGAPIKIAFLASDHLRKQGTLDKVNVKFIKGGPGIFAVKKYAESLTKVCDDYGVDRTWNTVLVSLDTNKKEATFEHMETKEQTVQKYDMIHVTPPMSAPDFIRKSALAASTGWVEGDDRSTLDGHG